MKNQSAFQDDMRQLESNYTCKLQDLLFNGQDILEFQEAKLGVPTIYNASISGLIFREYHNVPTNYGPKYGNVGIAMS